MEITATLVNDLRKRTGSGMMECKKALVETQGDIEGAIELMRKRGLAKADKKADRIAAEGIIVILSSPDNKKAVMLEINSETDFVARDENFTHFAKAVAATGLKHKTNSIEDLSNCVMEGSSDTVDVVRKSLISKLGENISLRRIVLIDTPHGVGAYSHGSRIGVLIVVNGGDNDLHRDLAMHIAALKPSVVSPEEVSAELIAKEREIYSAQAADSGKPAEIIAKMVDGRVKKYLDEISLVGQPFVKNPDQSVAQLLKEKGATAISFVRFEVGEGIEKQTVNFAEEVMAQVKSSS